MRRRISRFVALVLSAVLIVPASSASADVESSSVATVKIAVVGPMSEGAVSYGLGMRDAVKLAVADYSSQLASAGVSVEVVVHDDMGNPSTAVDAAQLASQDPAVLAVVGHVNSGCSIPASDYYQAAGLSMITPVASNPLLTQRGRNVVFRTIATDNAQGPYAADIAYKNLRLRRAFVVDDSTPYGRSVLGARFITRFKANGGTIAGVRHTSDRQTSFGSVVAAIKSAKPTVIYYGGIYNSGSVLCRQLRAAGVTAKFIGGDGIYDQEFVRIAGSSRASGAIATSLGMPVNQMPGGLAFRQRYRARYGRAERTPSDAYGYDAAQCILKAIIAAAKESGAASLTSPSARAVVRAKVAASDFSGVTGRVAFSSSGDAKSQTVSVFGVKDGAWRDCARVSAPTVPSRVARGAAFTAAGSLRPRHTPGNKPVQLRFYHRENNRWVLRTTISATASDNSYYTRYSARVRLYRSGTWMVRALHSDTGHAAMYSTARAITVR